MSVQSHYPMSQNRPVPYTYGQFCMEVLVRYNPVEDCGRRGQFAFNLLHKIRPKLATTINRMDGVDPFYNDELIPKFLTYVGERWDEYDDTKLPAVRDGVPTVAGRTTPSL